MRMTITEALARIKLSLAKIKAKREALLPYLTRLEHIPDPFAGEGGSTRHIEKELQAISDLEILVARLRMGISTANLATTLTLGEVTKPITEWLVWKRELAEGSIEALSQTLRSVEDDRRRYEARPLVLKVEMKEAGGETQTLARFLINVNVPLLQRKREQEQTLLGELDGQLSLLNATTFVEIKE